MAGKRKAVNVQVSEEEKERIRAKAAGLGLSMSEMMVRAADAFDMCWGPAEGRETISAVSYGELVLVHHRLADAELTLREYAQQLVGTRQMIAMLARDGRVDASSAARLAESIAACQGELRGLRQRVSSCLEDIDAVCDAWVATVERGSLRGEVRGRPCQS